MRTFKEIASDVKYEINKKCPIEVKKVVYAYKGSEVKVFDSIFEASVFSKNTATEIEPQSKAAYAAWWAAQRKAEDVAIKVWGKELREEYSFLTDKIFQLSYSEAYEREHSNGYDAIANEMESVVDFVNAIMQASE